MTPAWKNKPDPVGIKIGSGTRTNKDPKKVYTDRKRKEININDKVLNYDNILYLIFCYIELNRILVYSLHIGTS